MEFHISRAIREKLQIDGLLFSYTGNVVFADVAASRRLASQLQAVRQAALGLSQPDPASIVNAGALFAMGMIDELNHALFARYRKDVDPSVLSEALRWFAVKLGPENVEKMLLAFVEQFPGVDVYQGKITAAEWLRGSTEGMLNREAAIEELILLWLSNINPAFAPFRELFDDKDLHLNTPYPNITAALPDYLGTRPPVAPEIGNLYEALCAPMLASPDSITGQLDYIREQWTRHLGPDLRRVLLAIDVLREEDLAIWMRFNPPGPDQYRHAAPGFSGEGFIGNEYIGFDKDFGSEWITGADGVRHRRYATDYQAPLDEYEAFSADLAWMPNVVLIAKSTYVWLEQLSRKYSRHIHHLDHIPDEELQLIANRGITGLWLIGLWERSIASRTIKRLRGHGDAVASAYSLKEYNIAEDLGGAHGYANLRDRAASFGLRLASDMVPNHMGIDSPWVIEHPDWFISRPHSPFPAYSFAGPDISPDSRVEIKIEDHYYDQTDAAVVFRLRHHHDGSTRFVFHGNDGTSFAWNDTAQLDYSKAYVREHVIQTILHVARQFPIIRFDAAMVLAKRHVQRLWFPLPGTGGSIPSRAENAISEQEFDALMPHEFWREVVDRVAAEVPGTLLLAEAFWLLEGYFVRTLGMHRVYNSAFMNMLRDEENAKYRSYLKKTIEFDPDILKRYVNFMSNPDERTAIDQFGSGDKYFGVCTLLSTLPGLPMFGHGQIEGFTERYGMEFKRARMEEHANDSLVARHQHDIAPLLKNRWLFAESTNFVLYDFWTEHGTVDENVFAFSNRSNGQCAVVLYNNRYGITRGTIHASVAYMDKGSGNLRQTSLAEGMALPSDHHGGAAIMAYRDLVSGLEFLRRATDFHHQGLTLDLRGYQYVVLLNWRELRANADQPWDTLCDALGGRGVHSVDEALSMLRLRPLHEALRTAISSANIHAFSQVAGEPVRKTSDSQIPRTVAATPTAPPSGQVPSPEPSGPQSQESAPSAANPISAPGIVDPKLQTFLDESRLCFERAVELLPTEPAEILMENSAPSSSSDSTPLSSPADPTSQISQKDSKTQFQSMCQSLTAAAIRLPNLEQQFSTAWPPAVRNMLPSNEPGIPIEQTWSPALAWIVFRSFPPTGLTVELFDQLLLRSALAEIFSAMGVEGDNTWRAAARVRLLLWLAADPNVSIGSEEFWANSDVQWLTGFNESAGKRYINREQLEELICWLQLPALLDISSGIAPDADPISKVETEVAKVVLTAMEAGYDLDLFLARMNAPLDKSSPPTAVETDLAVPPVLSEKS